MVYYIQLYEYNILHNEYNIRSVKTLIAQNAIDEIYEIYKRANKDYITLVKELSRTDRIITDILHWIELKDFTLEDAYSMILKLKALRINRREIKDELEPLQILITMLENQKLDKIRQRIASKISKQKDRKYTQRVDIPTGAVGT